MRHMTSPPVSEDEIANAAGNERHPVLILLLKSIDSYAILPSPPFSTLLTYFSPRHSSLLLLLLTPFSPSSVSFSTIPGMGDVHDGVNFMRAACVIAVEKAKASFEPMLEVRYGARTHVHTHTHTTFVFLSFRCRIFRFTSLITLRFYYLPSCTIIFSHPLSYPFLLFIRPSTAPYISPPIPSLLSPSLPLT